MNEYNNMAKFYDDFYLNKDYGKETNFVVELLENCTSVLDVGCGTGLHMSLLEEKGYITDGLDFSLDMLEIAKTRVKGNLFNMNLLDFKLEKTYDAIISMFAVFNHLNDYKELKKGIENLYNHLNINGIIIIDLHNGRKSGKKIDNYNEYTRIMEWYFDSSNFKEKTNIKYIINKLEYEAEHIFKIYEMKKLKKVLDELDLKYKLFENYSFMSASDLSKNIQIVIRK